MSHKYRLLFVHGWGFSKDFWHSLVNLLKDYSIEYIDLGYLDDRKTSDDKLEKITENQDVTIVIGHSLGFLYLLKQFPVKFHHYVAINSFLRFSKADDFISGVPIRILQRMSKGIEQDSSAILLQFYEQSKYHEGLSAVINKEQLIQGLEWLGKDDCRLYLPHIKEKLTVIASDQDPVVSKQMTCDSFQKHSIQWVEDKTHILPLTKPNLCATIIKNISIYNEFK